MAEVLQRKADRLPRHLGDEKVSKGLRAKDGFANLLFRDLEWPGERANIAIERSLSLDKRQHHRYLVGSRGPHGLW